jgi:cytochrome P450
MTVADDLIPIPAKGPCLSGISPAMLSLQRERPVVAVRTPAGDPAWLFTRYEDVKALLADNRLGRSHPDPARAVRYSRQELAGGPMGNWETEDQDTARRRRVLARSFSARRIAALRPAIQELAGQLLDQMTELTPPADFRQLISFPLPINVIGRILGIPSGDCHQLGQWSDAIAAIHDPERSTAGLAALRGYARQLLQAKREQPGEDVFSDLVAMSGADPGLEQRAMGLAALLIFAGHETTASMIDYGVLHFLTRPDQRAALLRDPSVLSSAVEEILRYASPFQDVMLRYARTDIEVGGVRIRRGELILLSLQAANHDEKIFPDPSRFDVSRRDNPHLAFGHGPCHCIGSSLARLEIQIIVPAVFRRFPRLRLAVSPEELRYRDDLFTGGLQALPVTW